ncbi:MAG TPA: Rv3235 family protein [Streptosporangiaceae bacterium]|nr:Rv3235 family protein [Streptosporangiaceae bacterium]
MPDSITPPVAAIRAVAVPQSAPPYDDAPHDDALRASCAARPKAAVRRSAQRGKTRPSLVSARTADSLRDAAAAGHGPAPAPARRTLPPPVPSPWPGQFAQVLAETLVGSRPAEQIVPWTTEQARKRISQLGPLLATSHRPRVRRVIITSPARGVLEMTVILALGARVRALAVRLERMPPPERHDRTFRPPPAAGRPPGRPATQTTRRPPEAAGWYCTAIEAA